MRVAMLALLAKEPAHGYELRQRLYAAIVAVPARVLGRRPITPLLTYE